MWSLATSVAEALGDAAQFESHGDLLGRRTGDGPSRRQRARRPTGERSRRTRRPGASSVDHFGWLGEVTLIVPAMMSALSLSSSAFSVGGDLAVELVVRRQGGPLFASVPM